jgi:hypothetical protein
MLGVFAMDEEFKILESIETEKNKEKEDLRSILNKKSYSNFELDELMMRDY